MERKQTSIIYPKEEKPNLVLLCDIKSNIDKLKIDITDIKKDIEDIKKIIEEKEKIEKMSGGWWIY